MTKKNITILGIRGIPASHGGFETFAENAALYLKENGWNVTVYCQSEGNKNILIDDWRGIKRVHVGTYGNSALSTIIFDWKSILNVTKSNKDVVLILGYNTAIFAIVLKLFGIPNIINMDGIEWARDKWSTFAKIWFWINDWAGCYLGDHLIADHPEIKKHLETRVNKEKITVIPYGAHFIKDVNDAYVKNLNLVPYEYLTVIARPEPENSLYEIVSGFSSQKRNLKLVVLGKYEESNPYHLKVLNAASDEVLFVGPIYDSTIVSALRFYSLAYIHGHKVGGTNPSLVEALGAGNAVIAHDNKYNRWVANEGGLYFKSADECSLRIDEIKSNPILLAKLKENSLKRFHSSLTWPKVLTQYDLLLSKFIKK